MKKYKIYTELSFMISGVKNKVKYVIGDIEIFPIIPSSMWLGDNVYVHLKYKSVI